jgi:hypothetical protein
VGPRAGLDTEHTCFTISISKRARYAADNSHGAGVAQSVQYLTTDWTTEVRSPAVAKDYFSSLCVQASSEAHPAPCIMSTRGSFHGGKGRSGLDADSLPSCSNEVNNECDLYLLSPLATAWRSATYLL